MTREEARKAAEVMLAYAEGKEIEFKDKDIGDNRFRRALGAPGFVWNDYDYRIKPEPSYRPFKDAKECWDEMQKHQPFGWIMCKGQRCLIVRVTGKQGVFCENGNENLTLTGYLNDGYTFADGTPFGIKTEE